MTNYYFVAKTNSHIKNFKHKFTMSRFQATNGGPAISGQVFSKFISNCKEVKYCYSLRRP